MLFNYKRANGMKIIRWFKNISISKKLFFVVGIMALLIAVELFTLFFSLHTLSSVRAFVGGEGLWSKAQKNAFYNLQKYARTYDNDDYLKFQNSMKVPLGDHKTLVELLKKKPDLEKARLGFLEGRNHEHDIDGMILLFRRFHRISYINKALAIWIEADSTITKIIPISEKLYTEVNKPEPSYEKIEAIIEEVDPLNEKLSVLEDNFSYTLGEGARWLENLILTILLVIALTVEFTGLFLTISVSIGITKGINEIIKISEKVAKVNFNDKAKIYSMDEIGQLASSFNKMMDNLHENIDKRTQVELELRLKTDELIRSNAELEQFAYVASHDLQEPLRMISSYIQLVKERYKEKLDSDANEFIDFAIDGANRMRTLILSLLEYSRANRMQPFLKINTENLLVEVLHDLKDLINSNNAIIKIEKLPDVYGDQVLIGQLFQNLISNAIKFKGDANPEIRISCKKTNNEYLFSVKDNG
ncbi:MAG TPA: histidine kinase dimerization/phospho-acceptor domain-containing protein, partial [Bacteroidia bacterium]|nr:histidine kinase dimerization/phospho-acceptor domain-containing protein [Bacteroidia bacterium]